MSNGHFNSCTTPENCWCEIKRYWLIFGITAIILLGEIVGGIVSGSLALLADAGHVFTDGGALIVSIVVGYLVKRGDDENLTRAIGGIINALLLGGVATWVFVEALDRLQNPRDITSWVMISIAFLGTIGNYLQHRVLEMSDDHHVTHDALSLHILSDLAQSVAVIIGGMVIAFTGYRIIDPILSFGIAITMGYWAIRLLWKIRSGEYAHGDHAHHHHSH